MNNRNDFYKQLTTLAKERIEHFLPKRASEQLRVHFERGPKGNYSTRINLLYRKHFFTSQKEGKNLEDSMNKALKALLRQIEKIGPVRRKYTLQFAEV